MTNEDELDEDHETILRRLSKEIGEPITVGGKVVYEEGDRHVITDTEGPTEGPPPEADAQSGRTDMTAEVAAAAPEDDPERRTGDSEDTDAQPDTGVGGPAGARDDSQVDLDTDTPADKKG